MTEVRNYKVHENLLVITHTLGALYQNFYGTLPKEFEEKIKDLLDELIEYQEKNYLNSDIVNHELYRRVIFKDMNEKKK